MKKINYIVILIFYLIVINVIINFLDIKIVKILNAFCFNVKKQFIYFVNLAIYCFLTKAFTLVELK